MRSIPITLAATIAIAAAVPSAASAANGWKLSQTSSELSGLKTTSNATHCGASKFGTWKFRSTLTAEGQIAYVSFKGKITKDGKAHKLSGVHVTGTAPADVQTQIASVLRGEQVRYVPSTRKLVTLAAGGKLAGSRAFRPTRTTHC